MKQVSTDDCWHYAGYVSSYGYGLVSGGGKLQGAHRVMYENMVGPIPKELCCDHLCRVRCCINPDHIELVDIPTNTRRGISPSAINGRKTHCNNGHPLSGRNMYYDNRGFRVCKECKNAWLRRYRPRKSLLNK